MTKRPVDLAAVKRFREEMRELIRQHPELTSPEAQRRFGAWAEEEERMAKNVVLQLRLEAEQVARLDHLVEQFPIGTRSSVARVALLMGLVLLEEDPTRLLTKPTPGKKR